MMMNKSPLFRMAILMALTCVFACNQDNATAQNEAKATSALSAHDQPVKKIQKPGLSSSELAKLTRFQDEASGKFGYKNERGEIITQAVYDAAMAHREGNLARVMKDKKFGFVGLDGKEAVACQFSDAGAFSEDLAAVKVDGKWGFIDESGNMVIKPSYDFTLRFNEGMSSVQKGGKWGYINKKGEEVVPVKYNATGYFNNGLASVMLGKKWGYVDATNKTIIPFEYDRADPFGMSEKNAGRVTVGDKTFYINKQGECVKDCK